MSVMAVIILSQPLGGMELERSFSQVIDTTVGAALAVLLMGGRQTPLPFIITLAQYLALCTAVYPAGAARYRPRAVCRGA